MSTLFNTLIVGGTIFFFFFTQTNTSFTLIFFFFCTVLKATKILTKGLSGSIDPYATIDFGKGKTHKTKVVYQTTNPEWNEYYTG